MSYEREKMENKTILIADDDRDIIEILKLYLENEGYTVMEAVDGNIAWKIIKDNSIDIAVIDIMMPELDGFQLVKRIRGEYSLPVIILSARGGDNDKILGLGLGADDYMAKPFNPLELVARVQAQMRRFYKLNSSSLKKEEKSERIVIGDITLDKSSCTLYCKNKECSLTSTEFKIICYLIEQPGRVFTKGQIFEHVWGEYFQGDDNTIMVHISNIREKIEDDPRNPTYLKTIRGLGYRFEKKV